MATITAILWKQGSGSLLPIKIRITKDRKQRYISTGYKIDPKYWVEEKGRVRNSHPDHALINAKINSMISGAQENEFDMYRNGKVITADLLRQGIAESNAKSFLAFADRCLEEQYTAKRWRTWKRTRSVIQKIKTYVQEVRNRGDLAFHEVTVRLLVDYESYLKTTLGNSVTTVHSDFAKLQAIMNVAVSRDLLPFADNPFLKFKSQFKEAKKKKERLTADEVRAIKEVDLKPGTLIWNVRNAFLLSFYTGGLRIGDLLELRWRNIRAGRLDFMMEKTDKDRSVLLLPPAQDIIDLYASEERRPDHFIFPFLDSHTDYSGVGVLESEKERKTALINKYLKKIATAAGISKTLTSHLARHSAADLLRKSGASIFDISKILGHSKISVTEKYLESLDRESMDHEMGKLGEI